MAGKVGARLDCVRCVPLPHVFAASDQDANERKIYFLLKEKYINPKSRFRSLCVGAPSEIGLPVRKQPGRYLCILKGRRTARRMLTAVLLELISLSYYTEQWLSLFLGIRFFFHVQWRERGEMQSVLKCTNNTLHNCT